MLHGSFSTSHHFSRNCFCFSSRFLHNLFKLILAGNESSVGDTDNAEVEGGHRVQIPQILQQILAS